MRSARRRRQVERGQLIGVLQVRACVEGNGLENRRQDLQGANLLSSSSTREG